VAERLWPEAVLYMHAEAMADQVDNFTARRPNFLSLWLSSPHAASHISGRPGKGAAG
jgi:hypothetical protein